MNFFFTIFFLVFITKLAFSNTLFDSDEFILEFKSDKIIDTKQIKINQIKVKSFNLLLKKILTKKQYIKFKNKNNLDFVNNFILNMTIENEKIINNSYYSIVKINFDKNIIINFLIDNKVNYIDKLNNKFLIIIFEDKKFNKKLLSKKNNLYNFLLNSENLLFKKNFKIPELNFNDRYLLSEDDFVKISIKKINKFSQKYNTNYQILIHNFVNRNVNFIRVTLVDSDKAYFISEVKFEDLNYEKLFINIYDDVIDKWKSLNQINTNFTNNLKCKIYINNVYELKFVRSILEKNRIIKNMNLISIKLHENIYNINYYGTFEIFKKSLANSRLQILFNEKKCEIKLI